MSQSADSDDLEALSRLTQAWEQFDNTGDESTVVKSLHDDVVLLPPGGDPIVGKREVREVLAEFPTDAYDVDHTIVETLVGDTVAVVWSGVTGKTVPDSNEDPEVVGHTGLDVYRRPPSGDWRCRFSIWNDQA